MRSVPSFIGEFKRRDKTSRNVSTLKQQLPIEREANVRQLKKQILQRLKKETLLTDEAGSGAIDSPADLHADIDTVLANESFDEIDKKLAKTEWDAGNLNVGVGNFALGKSPQGRRKDFRFPFVDSPTSCKGGQQMEDREAAAPIERRKKSTGERAKILLHENQDELYVPSFASQAPATAERRRKTDDIKHKAAERRRVLDNERHSSSPDINIQANDTPLTLSVGSNALTPSLARRSGSTLAVNVDDTELKVGRRDTGTNNSFLAVSPRLARASSFPSVYEPVSMFDKDAHLTGFARKKQEELEEDLRRVEDCLNQTFSGLKKYLKTD